MGRLKWWFVFCMSVVAVVVASFLGWTQTMWVVDDTKLGTIIVGLYFVFSVFVGWLTYKAESPSKADVERYLRLAYLAVKSMVVLGIIGTTAGLLIMLHMAFSGAGFNPTTVLLGLKTGLSTLGISTLVGLVCYLALELQVVNLEYTLDA